MNTSYRSLWNQALGAWVAVSELTTARGQSASPVRSTRVTVRASTVRGATPLRLSILALSCAALWLGSQSVQAQTVYVGTGGTGGAGAGAAQAGGDGRASGGGGGGVSGTVGGAGGDAAGQAGGTGGDGTTAAGTGAGGAPLAAGTYSAGAADSYTSMSVGGAGGGGGASSAAAPGVAGSNGGNGANGVVHVTAGNTLSITTLAIGGAGGGGGAGAGGASGAGGMGGNGGSGQVNLNEGGTISATSVVVGGAAGAAGGGNGGAGGAGGAGVLNIAGGTLNTSAVQLNANGELQFSSAKAMTAGYTISGAGKVTHNGAGTTSITGNNTYTGGTTINAGVVVITNINNLGSESGDLTLNGGTLRIDQALGFTGRDVILGTNGGTIDLNNTFGAPGVPGTTMVGQITGSGRLTLINSGNNTAQDTRLMVANASNNYTGGTAVGDQTGNPAPGRLNIATNTAGSFGTGPIDIYNNADVKFIGTSANANNLTINVNSSLGINGVNSGVSFESGASAGNATIHNKMASGYVYFNSGSAGSSTIYNDAADARLLFDGTGDGGTATALNKGMVSFDGTNDASGLTIHNNPTGIVYIDATPSAGISIGRLEGAGSVVLGSKTLTVGGLNTSDTISGVISDTDALNGGSAWHGPVSATGGKLVKAGTGTLTLSADNTYTGGTTINAGTLQLGSGGTTGSVVGNIENNGTLAFNRSNALGVSGVISGTGGVNQIGSGTTTLTAVNTYQGATTVSGGTLALSGAGSIAASSGVTVQGTATFDVSGVTGKAAEIQTLAGNGNVVLGSKALDLAAGAGTFAGGISGNGQLIKRGTGTLALTGGSSFDGGVALKEGRLDVGSNTALGAGELAMDDGTTLGFAANNLVLANSIRLTGTNDPVIDTGATSQTLAGAITGTGFLTKDGTGTLTLTSTGNNYSGGTTVAAGTLRAGAANVFSASSAHTVASGATLDLAGFSQTLPSLGNAGTVSLVGVSPGTTLNVTGAYVGNGGTLRLGTALGLDGSASDRLVLSGAGASASGNTTVQVTNLGGLGGLTTGNGIEVISATGGATTTAQTTKDAFALAGGHVDAGAYEYRLYAADATGAGENWYLRSGTPLPPAPPPPPPAPPAPGQPAPPAPPAPAPVSLPTYRAEVPLFAALPAQLRQADIAMLGNMHQRIGDGDVGGAAMKTGEGHRRAWGRVISTDMDIRQTGTVSPASNGRLTGFQAGTDLWADANWRVGVYAGQLEGDIDVNGFARGIANLRAGRNDLRSSYFGVYGTYTTDSGFYADAVLQAGRHRYTAKPSLNAQVNGKGSSTLASIEVGQSFELAPNWKIEPQLQLVHQRLSLDDTAISGALVRNDPDNGWLVRAGVRVKGELSTGVGTLQPYARLNVYRSKSGTDVASFIGPAATTSILTRTGHTTIEVAAGATLALTERVSVYGEVGKLYASGGNEKLKSGVQGSVGLRVRW